MSERRFVILDRDGTIIEERHYLSDPDGVALLPGAAEGLAKLRTLGLGLIMVTNQSGVGRGYFDLQRLSEINQRIVDVLAARNVTLDGIYFCPHTPDDDCNCRKPKTGMVREAAREHGFDPSRAFVVGDKACDIELGSNTGATTVLVRTGYGATEEKNGLGADIVADDLNEFASIVTRQIEEE